MINSVENRHNEGAFEKTQLTEVSSKDSLFCWAFWTLIATIFGFIFVMPFIGLLVLLFFPFCFISAVCSIVGLFRAIRSFKWHRAAAMALNLVFILSFFMMPELIALTLGRASNIVHLLSQKRDIDSNLRIHPSKRPVFVADWGIWATQNAFVIYDESGRIALPESDPMWTNDDMELVRYCAGHVAPIINHYFRCDP